MAAAYGVERLWRAGYHGKGRRVAILVIGNSLPKRLYAEVSRCYGPWPTPHEHVVIGLRPAPGGEGDGDSDSLGTYTPPGASPARVLWPVRVKQAARLPNVRLGVFYPASSPYVTSVGGTDLDRRTDPEGRRPAT